MENLRLTNFSTALDLLRQSEELLATAGSTDISSGDRLKMQALTYNNLGCFYKK